MRFDLGRIYAWLIWFHLSVLIILLALIVLLNFSWITTITSENGLVANKNGDLISDLIGTQVSLSLD
jgi:hypothetical protein